MGSALRIWPLLHGPSSPYTVIPQVQYQTVCNCWTQGCLQTKLSTAPKWFTVVAVGAAKHAWYSTKHFFVVALVPQDCTCNVWQQIHLEYCHNYAVTFIKPGAGGTSTEHKKVKLNLFWQRSHGTVYQAAYKTVCPCWIYDWKTISVEHPIVYSCGICYRKTRHYTSTSQFAVVALFV